VFAPLRRVIAHDEINGFARLTLSNDELEVQVLPQLGGKICTLRRPGGANVLLEPPEFPYRRARPGVRFEDYDTSGFDECFPNVAEGPDPDDPAVTLPDHGDLWARSWEVRSAESGLVMKVWSTATGCELSRVMRLEGRKLRIDYELKRHLGDGQGKPRHFLWSAHPLLAVSEGSRIYLPGEVRDVLLEWSRGDRLGRKGARVPWSSELSVVGPRSRGVAEKVFTDALSEGWAAFFNRAQNQSIVFRFDVHQTPYLGLWISQGGWPVSRNSQHYTVALEPCSGRPDSLAEAVERGECRSLPPGGVALWTLELELQDGEPALR
jgi:hypothetical protein